MNIGAGQCLAYSLSGCSITESSCGGSFFPLLVPLLVLIEDSQRNNETRGEAKACSPHLMRESADQPIEGEPLRLDNQDCGTKRWLI